VTWSTVIKKSRLLYIFSYIGKTSDRRCNREGGSARTGGGAARAEDRRGRTGGGTGEELQDAGGTGGQGRGGGRRGHLLNLIRNSISVSIMTWDEDIPF